MPFCCGCQPNYPEPCPGLDSNWSQGNPDRPPRRIVGRNSSPPVALWQITISGSNLEGGTTRGGRSLGACPYEQVATLLGNSDIFVSLAQSDGVSCSLLESMAMGVFPIVSDIPGNRNWINTMVNGIIVSGTDANEVADAILKTASDVRLRHCARETNRYIVGNRANFHHNASLMAANLIELCGASRSI